MKLSVRILQVEQVTQSYVDWYLNKDVVKYSDNQYKNFNFEDQCIYVENCLRDNNINLYGIFDDTKHIGNIMIIGLTSKHKKAELTYVIGDTTYWGKGIATFAIGQMIEFAKSETNLNKLYAGLANENIGSKIVLEKNGFVLEGTRKKHLFYNGIFFDQLDYGLML